MSRSERHTKKTKTHRTSLIVHALRSLGDRMRSRIANGFIGSLFTSYDRVSDMFENSAIYGAVKKVAGSQNISKIRRAGSAVFDHSCVKKWVLALTRAMRHCTMRFYGVFMISFSVYVLLMYLIRKYGMFYTAPVSYLAVSAAVALVGFPLLFDRENTLGSALLESSFFSWLLFDFFGLRYEIFRDNAPPIKKTSIAFILGMVFGCLTFVISPLTIVAALGLMLYLYLSLVSPEAGFLLCLFFFPYLSLLEHPTTILCLLVICVLAGYFIKLFRHKRALRFGVFEGVLLLFMFLVLFGGTRNVSMAISDEMPVMLVLMSGTLVAANLLRSKEMIIHAIEAFSLSCVVSAVVGIVEYLLGMATLDWLDTDMFSDISGRAVSFFENPNVLGTYLCLGAPLMLCLMSVTRDRAKIRWFVGFCLVIACSVLTWSRGAWVGIAASVVIMLVCMRKTLGVVLGAGLLVAFSSYVIPSSVIDRFSSIGNTADSSTVYRLNIWRGCADMASELGLAGIGVGDEAFLRMYPKYAVAGAETAYHAHSLWLGILLMLGVCGSIIFAVMTFFFYQRSFTVCSVSDDKDIRRIVAACASSVSGLLIAGLFDYTWYNYRVLFAYFVVMGFVCACDFVTTQTRGGYHGCEY